MKVGKRFSGFFPLTKADNGVRRPRPLTKGKALIIAREVLGPNATVFTMDEASPFCIGLTEAWQMEKTFKGAVKFLGEEFPWAFTVPFKSLQDNFKLVGVGDSWEQALTMARG